MGDRDDIDEGEEPGLDDVTSRRAAEHAGADDAAPATDKLRDKAVTASEKLRNPSDPDNASSETS
jgi:hypothetical protein